MFNEKQKEYSKKQAKEIEVWQSPKYVEAKEKAIELINSKKYDLTEGDFWILMNETKTGKMGYTGLIISHNGCLKINDKLDNKVNPKGFVCDKEGYKNSLVYSYCDDDVYEVGEVSGTNCKNEYPYAMAFKRCFDRVVLKKCKLAYAGVYSDSEADEFTKQIEEEDIEGEKKISKTQADALQHAIENAMMDINGTDKEILEQFGYKSITEIKVKDYGIIVNEFKRLKGE